MFRCHVIKDLSAYLDNQLSEKQKARVEKHLKGCKQCSDELSSLKILSQKVKAWHAPDPREGFENSVRNEIVRWELVRGKVKMKKVSLAVLIPSSALAAILVFAFVGNHYLKRGIGGGYRTPPDSLGEVFDPDKYQPHYASNKEQKTDDKNFAAGSYYTKHNDEQEAYQEGLKSKYKQLAKNEAILDNVPVKAGLYRDGADYSTMRLAGSYESQSAPRAPAISAPYESSGGQDQVSDGAVIVIQPVLPATGIGDKIIRTGIMRLEVEDGKETYSKISLVCRELNGFLSVSNFYKDEDGREAGTITMRIPKEKFNLALERISGLGKVENINTTSQDVSQEYSNLQSQLDGVMIVYNKMLEALKKKQTTISDAVRLESELTPVLSRIQGLKNQIEYLNNAIAFTTVNVEFHESKISAKVLKESKRYIRESMLASQINAVKTLSKILPMTVALGILFVVAILIVVLVKNWIVKTFRR